MNQQQVAAPAPEQFLQKIMQLRLVSQCSRPSGQSNAYLPILPERDSSVRKGCVGTGVSPVQPSKARQGFRRLTTQALLLRPSHYFLPNPLADLKRHLPRFLIGVHDHVVAVQHCAVENFLRGLPHACRVLCGKGEPPAILVNPHFHDFPRKSMYPLAK